MKISDKIILSGLLFMSLVNTASSKATEVNTSKHVKVTPKIQLVDNILKNMTLEQKIGQKLMLEIRFWNKAGVKSKLTPLTQLNKSLQGLIKSNNIGGIALFTQNLESISQVRQLTRDLQTTAKQVPVMNNLPLLISLDQEGGLVSRFSQLGLTNFSGNMALGAAYLGNKSYKSTELTYRAMANYLNYLGINVDLAPDVDVNSNPKNPIIGVRSFSNNPKLVSSLGLEAIQGLNYCGVAATIKHFPGHGDTVTDSHKDLPLVTHKLSQAKQDLYPFQSIIKHNQPALVMIAHIQYPALDATKIYSQKANKNIITPATFSRVIQTKLLRESMGYKGVILSDALNMGAITNYFSSQEALLRTFKAGSDIALMPVSVQNESDLPKVKRLIQFIAAKVKSGQLSLNELNTSVKRILLLKANLQNQHLPQNCSKLMDYHQLENKISNKSITLIKNRAHIIPITLSKARIHIVAPTKAEMLTIKRAIESLQQQHKLSNKFQLSYATITEIDAESQLEKGIIKGSDLIIVANEDDINLGASLMEQPAIIKNEYALMDYAHELHKKTIFLSLKNPYAVSLFNRVSDAILLGYNSYGYPRSATLPSLVKVIFNIVKPQGKLPVDLTDEFGESVIYKYGFGLKY